MTSLALSALYRLSPETAHHAALFALIQKYGGDNMDPLTLSLNTIRGKALHAVMGYASHAQVFIAVAAVADWRVANASTSLTSLARVSAPVF